MEKVKQIITLHNDVKFPMVGFGTYKITEPETGIKAIQEAIDTGYQMIDTAEIYRNHPLVAKAMKQSSKKREEIFLVTKLWPNDNNPENLRKRLNQILIDLDTDYVDLILVHWPLPYGKESYHALEEFYSAGHARAIGVSNFNVEQLKELIKESKIKPMVNQIELNPEARREDIVAFAKENGIAITSWQTIMRGEVNEIPYLQKLAAKYNVDPAAIALSWAVQQGISVIPKASNPKHLKANYNNLNTFNLEPEEIDMINTNLTDKGPKMNSEQYCAEEQI